MEKRLGIIAIVFSSKENIVIVNDLISDFSDMIIARQGLPMPHKGISFISLVVEAEMNRINSLTGQLGRLEGIEVKTIVTKERSIIKEK
jgi:putative iron-only hydrogenase system regulator